MNVLTKELTFSEFLPLDGCQITHRNSFFTARAEIKQNLRGNAEVFLHAEFRGKLIDLKKEEGKEVETMMKKLNDKIKVQHSIDYPSAYKYAFKTELKSF